MPPPPAFKGLRFDWLSKELANYEEAIKQGRGPDFLRDLLKRYFKRFPLSRFGHAEDPPEEWMQLPEWELPAVEELVAPERRSGQSKDAHLLELDAFDALVNDQILTMTQVKNFMRRRLTTGVFAFEKGGEAWNIVMAKLAGIPYGKPGRQRTAFNVWARDKEAFIDGLVEKKKKELAEKTKSDGLEAGKVVESGQPTDEGNHAGNGTDGPSGEQSEVVKGSGGNEEIIGAKEVAGGKGEKGKKKKDRVHGEVGQDDEEASKDKYAVSIRQAVVKEEFEKLAMKDREQWQLVAKSEHEQRKAHFAALQSAGYSTEPSDRQGAIDRFPTWMLEVAEEARKITGLNISVFAGGPMPSAGGELRIIGVHAGRTMGAGGQSFGAAYEGAIQSVISQIYGEFLRDCFTKEDCEAMSLGSGRPTLDALYSQNDSVSVHAVPPPVSTTSEEPAALKVPSVSVAKEPGHDEGEPNSKASASEGHPNIIQVTTSSASSSTLPPPLALPTLSSSSSSSNPSCRALPPVDTNDKSMNDTALSAVPPTSASLSSSASSAVGKRALPTGDAKNRAKSNIPTPSTSASSLPPAPSTSAGPKPSHPYRSTSAGAGRSTTNEISRSLLAFTKSSRTLAQDPPASGIPAGAKRPLTFSGLPTPSSNTPSSSKAPTPSLNAPSSSEAPSSSRTSSEMPDYPSTINQRALRRREGTYRAMTTGGLPPSVINPTILRRVAQEEQDRADEAQRRAQKARHRAENAQRRQIEEQKKRRAEEEESTPPKERVPKTVRRRHNSLELEETGGAEHRHKGSASSPIELDSPASSRAPTPTSDVPRRLDPSSRLSSPSASSVASAVSAQLRPARVRASSPPGSSPIPLSMPPSTQPRASHSGILRRSVVHTKQEDEDSPMLPLLNNSPRKRSARDMDDAGTRSTRKRMRMGSAESEDEISVALGSLTPSSPVSGSPGKGKGKGKRIVLSHVEVPRGSRRGGSKSTKSGPSVGAGRSKYYGSVDPSSIDSSNYVVKLPADAPLYMHLTVEMCSNVELVDRAFIEVMKHWVRFEKGAGFIERGRLTTEGRPAQVGVWIGQARRAHFTPDIRDVVEYGKQVKRWWWHCAPEWRQVKGSDELRRGKGPWEELRVSGVNGWTSIMAALGWWMGAIATLPTQKPREVQMYSEETEKLSLTLNDVLYSLRQILGEKCS
ncbi:SERTA domain-containing protein 3 [Marasmius crinis-equi]|uniref:SERTA domain-containing protein 3 n=1 Tax=Marasmius crinis-equi TaxID=585013 RepID=A0ABR3FAM6_9AGAR